MECRKVEPFYRCLTSPACRREHMLDQLETPPQRHDHKRCVAIFRCVAVSFDDFMMDMTNRSSPDRRCFRHHPLFTPQSDSPPRARSPTSALRTTSTAIETTQAVIGGGTLLSSPISSPRPKRRSPPLEDYSSPDGRTSGNTVRVQSVSRRGTRRIKGR